MLNSYVYSFHCFSAYFLHDWLVKILNAVDVGAAKVIHAILEQPLGLLLCFWAIIADEGEKVELEEDTRRFQAAVVGLLHVSVAFGMGKNGTVSFLLDALQDLVEAHRRVEIGRLDKQVVGVVAQGQEVVLRKTFLKETVEHVLGCEVENDVSLVG